MSDTIDFYILTLYPSTLLNSLVLVAFFSFYFLCLFFFFLVGTVDSLGFPVTMIMSMNNDGLSFSFPICVSFISFSCPIALVRVSSKV